MRSVKRLILAEKMNEKIHQLRTLINLLIMKLNYYNRQENLRILVILNSALKRARKELEIQELEDILDEMMEWID